MAWACRTTSGRLRRTRGSAGAEGQRADAGPVRSVLRQLVAGVSALHGKGKLHRDIKPSNIMVRPDGRVVILDFGLMSDTLPSPAAADDRMAGTPAYLAPEQHAGADPSEASDWYAVGVTLYEALTGRLPFDGSWHELGWRKRHSDPPPPASIEPHVPDDLNEICMGLLCRDPERRLSGRDALDKLVDRGAAAPETRRREPRRPKPCFVGRARQLAHSDRVVRRGQRGPRGGRVRSRSLRHRQDRAGPAVPRPGARRRCGGAPRPLLRARVRSVQGARRDHGQPESYLGRLRRRRWRRWCRLMRRRLSRRFPCCSKSKRSPRSARTSRRSWIRSSRRRRILVAARAADPNGGSPTAGAATSTICTGRMRTARSCSRRCSGRPSRHRS